MISVNIEVSGNNLEAYGFLIYPINGESGRWACNNEDIRSYEEFDSLEECIKHCEDNQK